MEARWTLLQRRSVWPWGAAAVVLAAAGLSACSVGRSSHCGSAYTLNSPHGSMRLGGCNGSLGPDPAAIQVRVGDEFDIHAVDDADGTAAFRAPTAPDRSVVVRTSGSGGDGTYEAVGVGTTVLTTRSMFCAGAPVDPTATTVGGQPVHVCPVLRVTVTK